MPAVLRWIRLSSADRLWTDVALPYGNRVSLTLPADLFGRSVQEFFVPVQDQEAEEATDTPMDELSRSLAALTDQYLQRGIATELTRIERMCAKGRRGKEL